MGIFTSDDKLNEIINAINAQNKSAYGEDILIQYPNSPEEMLVPGNTTITPINRRMNRRLRSISVSIPELGMMQVTNNNITRLFFSGESGTLEFPRGIWMEDVTITLTNAGPDPARFNYRMVFSE